MASVNIDSTWLTANGPAPYRLSQANTNYVLQQDVNVTSPTLTGEVFLLTGANVTLALNGFYVTLNGADVPQSTDSSVYRRVSEHTQRSNPANPVHQYGGTVYDGTKAGPMIDPASPEFPPLTKYAKAY